VSQASEFLEQLWKEHHAYLEVMAKDDPPASFQEAIESPVWLSIIKLWADARFIEENIAFLQAVKLVESGSDTSDLIRVYDQFVKLSSPHEINIASGERGRYQDIFEPKREGLEDREELVAEKIKESGTEPSHIFDPALREVVNLMREPYTQLMLVAQQAQPFFEHKTITTDPDF
jgi:hypothetical protein